MIDPTAFVSSTMEDGHVSVVVSGEIDLSNVDDVNGEIGHGIPNHATSASIDLTRVTYIDSVGMRLFFDLAARLRTAQIEMKIIAPMSSPARRIVEISGLTAVVAVDPA
jgi:stage II sporulation protein AA (anti-sigma F factor antagonist)